MMTKKSTVNLLPRLVCGAVCAAIAVSVIHGASPTGQSSDVLRNSDIMTMIKAGISPEVIVLKIKASTSQFDTSADALAVLKAGGVSDSVIGAMIEAGSRSANTRVPTSLPKVAPQRPAKPVLLVQTFTVVREIPWPYDMKQLQMQTVAELKAKDAIRAYFDIFADKPADATGLSYTLDGEVLSWKAGNRATRFVVGLGAGRETAEMRYWLTDDKGARVFEHKDTIRAEFLGNAYAGSVGQLAHPFASKIADRLTDAKLSIR